jgi:anti-sigma factor RsiW
MSCKQTLQTQSFLDGERTGAEAEAAALHMESCTECQALATDMALVSDALRNATRHRAPAALRGRVAASLQPPKSGPRPARGFWLGAASGTGSTALAAGLALFFILPPSAATLTAALADAHAKALLSGKTIMVASSDHHTVKPWLAEHVAISPPADDFATDGFPLIGGRSDNVAGTRAAVAVYRHGNHEVDLFAWPDRGVRLPEPAMTHGFRSAFWKSGDLDFAAISDVDAAAFEKFISLARTPRE